MPEKVHNCVESVLDDNPDMDESRAWAICKSQMEANVEDIEISTLGELGLEADDLDELASEAGEWVAHDGVWSLEEEAAIIYDAGAVPDVSDEVDIGPQHEAASAGSASQEQDGFAVDVFRIVQADDGEMDLDDDLMGVGVDFPNAGVYVDWHIDAWPDDEQLQEPHVSDYGSIEDLEQATGGVVEPLETVDAATDLVGNSVGQEAVTLEQQAEVDAVKLHFPPGGEVIDHQEGDWDEFLDDLSEHGDVFQMWKGLQRHPEDDLESHDHATFVALEAGSDVTDIEAVLDDHPAVDYVIDPTSVLPLSKPEGWDPVDSDHVPMPDQQAVTISGLSQEAVTDITRRYNADVVGQSGADN